MSRAGFLSFFLFFGLAAAASRGEALAQLVVLERPDGLASLDASLRWDDVEGPPSWISGARPRFSLAALHDLTRLEPGSSTSVLLPEGALLRIHSPGRMLERTDLEVTVSDGFGLEAAVEPIISTGTLSVFLHSTSLKPTVIEIARPRWQDGPVEIGLFVSRVERSRAEALYRTLIPLPSEPVSVSTSRLLPGERHWRIDAEGSRPFSLEGPARLLLSTRLEAPAGEESTIQGYRLRVAIDDTEEVFDFETPLDTEASLRVDGAPAVLGGERVAYLDVPEGSHRARIACTSPVLARLLRCSPRDFLLSSMPPDEAYPGGAPRVLALPSGVDIAWLVKDNSRRDNGLLGAMHCRELATGLGVPPEDRAGAAAVYRRHARYRSLVPASPPADVTQAQGLAQRFAWFSPRRPARPGEVSREVVLREEHLGSAMEGLSPGFFFAVPLSRAAAHVYRIPERFAPSLLRIAVDRGRAARPCELHVEMDDEPAVRLTFDPAGGLASSENLPTQAEAALAALRGLSSPSSPFTASTFSGPFSRFRTPARIAEVSIAELPLPRGAAAVRLWSEGDAAPLAAVQYLADSPHEPTEAEHAAAARRIEPPEPYTSAFWAAFEKGSRGDISPAALRDLAAGWTPLFRWLALGSGRFLASAAPSSRPGPVPAAPAEEEEAAVAAASAHARETAAHLEATGDWLPALESRRLALGSGGKEAYRAARLRSIDDLERLGERFLAEMQLRGILIHETDEELRHDAFDRLLAIHAEGGDAESTQDLLAAIAMETRDPPVVRLLAGALAADGQHSLALAAGSSLPAEEQPLDDLLLSAFHLRWWSSFDSFLETLPEEEGWHYWRGIREATRWRPEEALRHFALGGPDGQAMGRSLRRALALREAMASGDRERRLRSVLSWEEWHASQPGPWSWVEEPGLIVSHAGSGLCRSTTRDLYIQHSLATPSRPLRLKVAGPAALRIEARPLHAANASVPLSGWVEVREEGLLRPIPIAGNLPATGLELPSGGGKVPGTKVTGDVSVGPGLHEIEIAVPGMEALVRALVLRPDLNLGILPPLSPFTLERALFGDAADPITRVRSLPSRLRLIRTVQRTDDGTEDGTDEAEETEQTVPIIPLAALSEGSPRDPDPSIIDPILEARIALRSPPSGGDGGGVCEKDLKHLRHREALRAIASGRAPVRAEERLLAAARLGELDPLAPGIPAALSEAALLAAGRLEDLLALPVEAGEEGIRRRLTLLAYVAERAPELARRARVAGEALHRANARVPGLQGLFLRLTAGTDWRLVGSMRDSAGIRHVEVSASSPESPELRVRKALLSPFARDERLVTGESRLGISLSSSRPVVLELDVRFEAVEYLPRVPLSALYQLDDGEPRAIQLSHEEDRRSFSILVPEGDHAVRIWIEEPVANHYLRVRAREPAIGGPEHATEEAMKSRERPWSSAPSKRLYSISTPERPLRIALDGPSWLRIDELRDGHTITRYREVPEGLHEIVLEPGEGRGEGLFRIFERAESAPGRPLRPVRAAAPGDIVPPPLVRLEDRPARIAIEVEDVYALGGQEDGTISLEGSFHRVKLYDEDGGRALDQYFQLASAHRIFKESWHAYFETAVLARLHDRGGPTLGIGEDIQYGPTWFPASLRLRAEGYLQWPDGGFAEPSGPAEGSATLRGSVSRRFPIGLKAYHLPSAAVFGRLLSLDDSAEFRPGEVDPDVFTEYKSDHRHGLILSETIGYRPWIDTEWWAAASVASNEDFDPAAPDHVTGYAGWKQYIDGWQVDLHYRAARFFVDDDRDDARTRHAVVLAVLHDIWWTPRDRLEGGFELVRDFPDGEIAGSFFLAWHFSHGRAYRDFRPGDIEFPVLRSARIPPAHAQRTAEASLE